MSSPRFFRSSAIHDRFQECQQDFCSMKKLLIALGFLLIAASASAWVGAKRVYPDRWVYLSLSFKSDKDVADFRRIARTAADHGLTGIVLPGMDRISLGTPEYLERLRQVKQIADADHLEIIPSGFNTGYGGAILMHDKNLAEGMLVKDALFVAASNEARFVPDSPVHLENGGFERFEGDRVESFTEQDEPGHKTFVDTTVSHSGRASLRIENFGDTGIARVVEEIRVTPNRCYRVRAWVKTEDVEPASLFSIKSFTPDGRDLSPFEPPAPSPTSGWRQVTTAFNSWYADPIKLNVGVFEGVKGRVWVDDVEVEEVGLMNVVRRAGTPLTVRDEATGTVYEEGRDFAPISDPGLDFLWTHDNPSIHLLPGGRIHEGARLRVSYYHGTTIYNDQVPACPSEPKTREIWKAQFPLIEKYLAPKRYFLGIDEVRLFNRCEACRRRKMSAAAMIGDTTRWLYEQVRSVNPQAQVLIWSDMFDPNHNSQKQYYFVDGSLADTWEYLPKDLGMVCWYYEKRRESLDFFASRGFKTYAAAYYDADDLTNPAGWLDAMDQTPGAAGILYTTWNGKYKLLAPFGDLVSRPR